MRMKDVLGILFLLVLAYYFYAYIYNDSIETVDTKQFQNEYNIVRDSLKLPKFDSSWINFKDLNVLWVSPIKDSSNPFHDYKEFWIEDDDLEWEIDRYLKIHENNSVEKIEIGYDYFKHRYIGTYVFIDSLNRVQYRNQNIDIIIDSLEKWGISHPLIK